MRAVIAASLRRLAHWIEPAPPVTQTALHYHLAQPTIQPQPQTPTYPLWPQWWAGSGHSNRCTSGILINAAGDNIGGPNA